MGRRLTVAVEAGQSSEGTVRTELRENAVGVPGRRGAADAAGAVGGAAGEGVPVGWRLVHLDRAGLPSPRRVLRRGAVLDLVAAGRRAHTVVPSENGARTVDQG